MILKISLVMFFAANVLSQKCCCELKNKGYVPGRLEAYVVLGLGKLPKDKCVIVRPSPYLKEERIGTDLQIWLRAVFFDELNKPIPNRMILLDVVDVTGQPIQDPSEIVITPSSVQTNMQGFNESQITVKSTVIGVYRIRATYDDKRTKGISYSPPIYFR